jgi:tetratricopeptide (TPR) repeat protein
MVPLTVLAYQPAWHGALLWDDEGHVTSAALRSAAGLWRIWFEAGATQQYYPIVHSAFWLQWWAWGDATTGYHLVSILLHAGSACLLALALRRLAVPGALVAAAIFAIHPVHVESVAWISELKNTLSGLFYFAAALCYLEFDASRRRAAYVIALGLFVAALLSKSVTATLPAGLLIVLWWRHGRLDFARDVRPLLAFFVLGIAAGATTVWMERTFIGAHGAGYDFTLVERGLIAGRAIPFYLASLLWPSDLAFSYARWDVSQSVWWQYLYPAAVMAALGIAWRLRSWSRAPLAVLLFFCVTLGPALGFVNVYPFAYSFVADHFQYLASAGVIAGGVAALTLGAGRVVASRLVPGLLAVAIVVPLAWLTWRDSHAWIDNEVLYRTTIARSPDAWLPHNNLAALLIARDPPDAPEALTHAREAVRLAPHQAATHFNLGLALEAAGDHDAAIASYQAAIDRASAGERDTLRMAPTFEGLARALAAAGRHAEAADAYTTAARLAPDSMTTHTNAGLALLRSGDTDAAIRHLSRAVELAPWSPDAHFALGLAYEQTNQHDLAMKEFVAAAAARPSDVSVWLGLGRSLYRLREFAAAAESYRAALALDPSSAQTHNDLGAALAQLGRFHEAAEHFAEAVRLRPDDVEAAANLARARQAAARGGRRDE